MCTDNSNPDNSHTCYSDGNNPDLEHLIAQNEHLLFRQVPTLLYNDQRLPIEDKPIDVQALNQAFGLCIPLISWEGLTKMEIRDVSLIWDGESFLRPGETVEIGEYAFLLQDVTPKLGLSYTNTNGQEEWVPFPEEPGVYTIGRDEPTDPVKADIVLPGVNNTVHRRHVTLHVRSNQCYGLELADFVREEYYSQFRRFNMPLINEGGDWKPLGVEAIHRLIEGTLIQLGTIIAQVTHGK